MILSKLESDIIERLRVGMNQLQISEDLDKSRYTIGNIVDGLIKMSAVQKITNGKYKVLADVYDIADGEVTRTSKLTVVIPEGFEEYIRAFYPLLPRKELAKRLGLDKFTLNMMILQLGLGGK